MAKIPGISSIQPVGQMRLIATFRNGERRAYDCRQLLNRPQFHLLADPGLFRAVKVDAGGYGVSWTDEIDLSDYELWTNGEPVASNTMHTDAPPSRG